MAKARYKFTVQGLSFLNELILCQKAGFKMIERTPDGGAIFEKLDPPSPANDGYRGPSVMSDGKPYPDSLDVFEVSDTRQDELARRCMRIVKLFEPNIDDHKGQIKTQIHNMAQSLNAAEQEFCHTWLFNYVL